MSEAILSEASEIIRRQDADCAPSFHALEAGIAALDQGAAALLAVAAAAAGAASQRGDEIDAVLAKIRNVRVPQAAA